MSISNEFYNIFINSWNENIGEFIRITNNCNYRTDDDMQVVYNNGMIKEIPQFSDDANICFFTVFNGPACDEDHWEFFKECLSYAYQKNGFIQDTEKNVNVFREYWNAHIDEFNKSVSYKYNKRYVTVILCNILRWYELTPNAFQCFYSTFNGTVCDSAHWYYFLNCLQDAKNATGIYTERASFIKSSNC